MTTYLQRKAILQKHSLSFFHIYGFSLQNSTQYSDCVEHLFSKMYDPVTIVLEKYKNHSSIDETKQFYQAKISFIFNSRMKKMFKDTRRETTPSKKFQIYAKRVNNKIFSLCVKASVSWRY